ncbi:MAG: DNA methyltransferase [Mesonia sp.]
MNQKRDDVLDFLDNKLPKEVRAILESHQKGDTTTLKKNLDEAIKMAKEFGLDPDTTPKVQEARALYENAGSITALEQEVFSHLASFFKRYYQDGDFISLRRYKKDVYAIPYEGEEVKLHWANHDQYYIKTSENLKNYAFKIDGDKTIKFTLKEANTEQNNNKTQKDQERRFALYEEEPITIDGDTLHLNFTYEPHKKTVKQDKLLEDAVTELTSKVPTSFAKIFSLAPTEKNKKRTLLEKYLNDFSARNTFDYFIHKDLGGFLTRELDFYIKNEVLFIDDINTENEQAFNTQLSKIRALKQVAQKIITFLAQIENFQKKLWLKKKFVISCDYCITLDRIPEEYYAEIFKNEAQLKEWKSLFNVTIKKEAELKEEPFLVLDTKFFSREFKDKLLAEFDDLDEIIDGTIMHSDNFQALSILEDKFEGQIDASYIDPPYNTGSDGFIYKDGFKSSSWNSLLFSVLSKANSLLSEKSILMVSNDDNENSNLVKLLDLSNFKFKTNLIWNSDGHTDNQFEIKINHEYISLAQKSLKASYGNVIDPNTRSESNLWKNIAVNSITKNGSANPYSEIELPKGFPVEDTEGIIDQQVPPKEFFSEIGSLDYFPRSINKKYKVNFPIRYNSTTYSANKLNEPLRVSAGWANLNKLKKFINNSCKPYQDDDGLMEFYLSKNGTIYYKKTKESARNIVSVLRSFQTTEKMKYLLEDMDIEFSYPKPIDLIEYLLKIGNSKIYLDFFAGSGTTGHAVINGNRVNENKSKYILVELGSYFYEVLIPRMQKVTYSNNWKNGKPQDKDGISQMFKYFNLESYEDALNNLQLKPNNKQQQILSTNNDVQEDYMLNYMLDVESREHLMNVEAFKNPFNYKLKVTENNELIPTTVDLVETFNYLIGLHVKRIQRTGAFKTVEGITNRGDKVLVIWRNLEESDNEDLNKFVKKMDYNLRDGEFDTIYVNGDNNLANLKKEEETWKVLLLEEVFFTEMFDVKDV